MKAILAGRVFLVCASLVAASLGAKADLINLNFSSGTTDVAGVYGTDGQTWNGFNSNYHYDYTYQYPATALLDAGGHGTGVDVTFSGTGGGNTPNFNYVSFDPTLFGHYLYVNTGVGQSQSIDFSGLTAGNYDLVIYSNNNSGGTLSFDVNGAAESFSPTSESSFSANNNYISVDVTVGSNTDLNITNVYTGGGGYGLSGLQIEALPPSVPEPSALSMFVGGGLLLVFFLRRKLAANL